MYIEIWRMNNEFHQFQNYQKFNEYQFINNMFFGAKKKETTPVENTSGKDLELITKMNQEFAMSLDLKETLNNSLELIIKRINAQAANIFLIDKKNQSFQCIASKHQAYLEDFEIPITQGVMGKAAVMKKCIRVGDVRKDVREIAEFYFDLEGQYDWSEDYPNSFNITLTNSEGIETIIELTRNNQWDRQYVARHIAPTLELDTLAFSQPMESYNPPCRDSGDCFVERADLRIQQLRPSLLETMPFRHHA